MRRIALIVAVASIAALGPVPGNAGHGGEDVSYGPNTILSMAPGTKAFGILGITEGQGPCDTPSPDLGDVQGVDGYWLMLPIGVDETPYVGHSATLTHTSADMDVWFYTGGCGLILEPEEDAYSMATDLDLGSESGVIPVGAQWVIVDQAVGVNGSFTFTIEGDFEE